MFNAYFIYSSITTNVVECNMKGCNEKRNIMGEVHHGDKRKKHKPISDESFTPEKQCPEVTWFAYLERVCQDRTEGTLLLDGEGILFSGVGL